MYFPPKSSSIVIVGKWNPFILSPVWVGQNIFHEDEIKLEFTVGPLNFTKLIGSKGEIIPSSSRVRLIANDSTEENFDYIEILAKRLIETLPHTPISAVGFNFSAIENVPTENLKNLFNFSDDDRYAEYFSISERQIIRKLSATNYVITVTLVKKSDNQSVNFDFNFHYNISEINEIRNIFTGTKMKEHYNIVNGILTDKYGLIVSDDEQ